MAWRVAIRRKGGRVAKMTKRASSRRGGHGTLVGRGKWASRYQPITGESMKTTVRGRFGSAPIRIGLTARDRWRNELGRSQLRGSRMGAGAGSCAPKIKKPSDRKGGGLLMRTGRLPTLPHTCACSTIGAERLNYRVRDGNGWVPLAKVTQKERSAFSDQLSALSRPCER